MRGCCSTSSPSQSGRPRLVPRAGRGLSRSVNASLAVAHLERALQLYGFSDAETSETPQVDKPV